MMRSKSVALWMVLGVACRTALADPIGGNIAIGFGLAALFAIAMAYVAINAVIGLLEACLVAAVFRLRFARTVGILVLANLVSGLFGLSRSVMVAGDFQPASLPYFALSCLVAIVVEWPFLYWALPNAPDRSWNAWKASALAQGASYAVVLAGLIVFRVVGA